MSYAKFHAGIAKMLTAIEAMDAQEGPLDPYITGPIKVMLEDTHVGNLVEIDAGMWMYEEGAK